MSSDSVNILISLPFYPCTIYPTLMLYIISLLGDYLCQSYCFDSCNLGSDCNNNRKCLLRRLDDRIVLTFFPTNAWNIFEGK